jgi:hypothetical protein
MDEDGKPIVFFDDFGRFVKHHENFVSAGVKIHTSILFSGWVGIDRYDYELTDQVLDALLKNNPDIYYVPRIKLNVPSEWCRENPEDVFVYYDGPRNLEEVRSLVGTEKHDILGYNSERGYYTAGSWEDDRPNVDGIISNQSFSSEKWLQDAGETLRRLIEHLENGPYGKQIIGYHIAYGVSGETCLWGRFGKNNFGDYGINNRRAFFDWGMERYKSLEALREAWNNPSLDKENIEPPPPEIRTEKGSLEKFFRAENRISVDYDIFMSEVNAKAIESFGRVVKENTGKAVGCFYGYFMGCSNSAYTGWLAYDRILNSPYVDFIAAPKVYYRSVPGEPGGELAPAQSVNRRKLWMDELDNRTHLCVTQEKQCADFNETRTVMWREFSKNISHGSNFWWMDLGGGWFDSPEILSEVAKIEETAKGFRARPGQSISEILLVVDEESVYCHSVSNSLHRSLMQDMVSNANLCGAPVDLYRLNDLDTLDLSQYKLIVFLNTFRILPEYWKRIKSRIPEDATLLMNYAPGILKPEYSIDNIETLTGFQVKEKKVSSTSELRMESGAFMRLCSAMKQQASSGLEIDYPLLEIIDPENVLARYEDGSAAVAIKKHEGRKIIYSVLPFFSPEHIRCIAVEAGCHMYAPLDCAVYGDSRFIGLFPRRDIQNENLELKTESSLVSAVSGKRINASKSATINLRAKEMEIFIFD